MGKNLRPYPVWLTELRGQIQRQRRRGQFARRKALERLEDRVLLTSISLAMPTNLNAFQGGIVAVPVLVNQLSDGSGNSGLSSASFAINFDSAVFSVSGGDIFQGTAGVSDASLFNISSSFASGQLEINLSAPTSAIASVVGTVSTPITVTTVNPLPAGLNGLDSVTITGVTGFAAANGTFGISVTGNNTFTLNGTNGAVGTANPNTGTWASVISDGGPGATGGATNGSLVVIDFHVKGGAALGASAINLVSSNSLGSTVVDAANGAYAAYGLTFTAGSVNILSAASTPNLGYFTEVSPLTIGGDPGIGTMLLLSDGSIMAQGGYNGAANTWYRLTPDASGNYFDGTWHQLASSNIGRLYYGSVVMQNGDVMVLGGEDTNISGNIASVVGTGSGPITVTTANPLPTDLTSGTVTLKGITGFGSFKINAGFTLTVTGTNTFTLNGTAGTVGTADPNTGTFTVNETNTGEIFTPPTTPGGMGSWQNITAFPQSQFGDGNLELMSDGTVLAGFLGGGQTYRYNPALDPLLNPSLPAGSNPWTPDASLPANLTNGETGWTKLPDGSILSYQLYGFADNSPQTGGRLVFGATPALDQWVGAGSVPVPPGASGGATVIQEMGPSFLLPDGRVFEIGSNGNTALYSPPALAGNATGTWVAGPIIPNGEGATDAPGAMMTNGDILFTASPYMTNGSGVPAPFNKPTTFYEYNPTTNTITLVPPDDSGGSPISDLQNTNAGVPCFVSRMLDLPNGQVLYTDETGKAYVYTPDAAPNGTTTPLSAWRPVINSIKENGDGSFTLTGTQITGLSEGATYGDDAQMASNYPIVALTDSGGNVTYVQTTNWSTAWVQTGSTPETVNFNLPSGKHLSDYKFVTVIANGIASNEVTAAANPNVIPPADQTGIEGAGKSFNLGSFIDPDGGPWTVDVNWGDGTADTTFGAASTGSLGSKSHTFGEEGNFTVTVTVTDSTSLSGDATFQVAVSDPAVLATGVAVNAVEGAALTGVTIATFTDPGGAEPNPADPSGTVNDHYKVDSIDWGDGTPLDTSSGTVNFNGSAGSTTDSFTVSGSHTFAEEGSHTLTAIIDHEGVLTTVMAAVSVSDPAVVGTGTAVSVIACVPLTGVAVATFTDPGGAEPNASDPSGTINDHYQVVSINWGDGSPPDTTTGVLSYGGSPESKTDSFTVSGSHTYAVEGIYTITTIIKHESAPMTTVLSTATVRDNIGLLVLDPTGARALTVSGNGVITVNNCGAVVVDSSNAAALNLSGNASVSAMDIDVTGGILKSGNATYSAPIDHEPPMADPLGLPLPPAPGATFAAVNYFGSTTLTLSPGTYLGGIKDFGLGNIVLLPGVYYLKGGGLQIYGPGSVTGAGVLIINAPSSPNDNITISGNGTLALAPAPASLPLLYAAYKGITIFQDPASTAAINLSGNGSKTIDGALYAPDATLNVSGNATLTDSTDTTAPIAQIIVRDANISGNAGITINADAAASNPPANMPLPSATPTTFVSLVSSANSAVPGQSITYTATMAAIPSSAGPPTGSIAFFDQTTHLDLGSAMLVGGVASATTSILTLGNHTITATYFAASPNFAPPGAPATLTQHMQSEVIESGVLFVGGNPNSTGIQVQLNGSQVAVNLHDGTPNFQTPLAGLTALVVYGQSNVESIQVDHHLLLPAFLFGGDGTNIQIQGGGGPTVEVGGSGGAYLQGGTGRNILIAGAGGGFLQGGSGGSILIGGYSDYDANLPALMAALAEWSSGDSYGTRTTSAALSIFSPATVHSDGHADILQGGGGAIALDWIFASSLDQISAVNAHDIKVSI